MAIDRAAALRQAEKLLRLGKLEAAIAEYERIVAEQPQDWTTANTLGDLYARAGHIEQSVQAYTRIADAFAREGFTSKSAALYKKILKLQPENESTLLKAGEISAGQGLLADARTYFNAVARRRSGRGDLQGVARIAVRLAALDPLDITAKLAGAHARVTLGETPAAIRDLKDLVVALVDKDRLDDAERVRHAILEIDPADLETRSALVQVRVAAGDTEAALQLATVAGGDPTPLLHVIEAMARSGRVDDAHTLIDRLLAHEGSRTLDIARLGSNLAQSDRDTGYGLVLRAADAAVARHDWTSAAAALQEFLRAVPQHVPALTRLLEIAIDGGLDDIGYRTQADLADAYLDGGTAREARFITEDLLARQPEDAPSRERLVRIRALMGEPEPDEPLVEPDPARLSVPSVPSISEMVADVLALPSPMPAPEAPRPVPAAAKTATTLSPANQATIDLAIVLGDYAKPANERERSQTAEIDLSVVLDDIRRPAPPAVLPADLDGVFAHLREEVGRRPLIETAEQDLKRGQTLFQCGQLEESLAPLQSAARVPRLRFESASLLGRACRDLGRPAEALEWTERAAEAPAPTPEEGHQVLFELADALEKMGETARALAVCLELQADTGDYGDLAARVERLTKVQARG